MYKHHRFPPEIIQYTVWLYHCFNLSARDIKDLMAERGSVISYESSDCGASSLDPDTVVPKYPSVLIELIFFEETS